MMKKHSYLFFLTLSSLFFWSVAVYGQADASAGKSVFNSRCAACHNVHKKMVGPALHHVYERHTTEWIINFVHNSQKMVQAGDTSAVRLFTENNKVVMPPHPDLSATAIQNVVAYIKAETNKESSSKAASKVLDNYKPYEGDISAWHQIVYLNTPGDHQPVSTDDTFFWGVLGFAIVMLVTLLLLIVKVGDWGDVVVSALKHKKADTP